MRLSSAFPIAGWRTTHASPAAPSSGQPMSPTCSAAWNSRVSLSRRLSMLAPSSFDYAIVRVVPRVERGEFVNAGVVLFCRTRRFLGARIELDERRLLALAPDIDLDEVRRHLDAIIQICAGGPQAGPIGELPQAERFHWL